MNKVGRAALVAAAVVAVLAAFFITLPFAVLTMLFVSPFFYLVLEAHRAPDRVRILGRHAGNTNALLACILAAAGELRERAIGWTWKYRLDE